MQTTLLGLAVALIVALVSALVGPLMVDWGRYRPNFEAEASRLAGMPVKIAGTIDARLLPVPSLVLRNIEAGAAGRPTLRARALEVSFGLGALVRGEWRAEQLTIDAPEIGIGLDAKGALDTPPLAIGFDADQLSIDRLAIRDARVTLTHAKSGGSLVLDKLSFNGEARSLIGPFKGDGIFTAGDRLYGFKLAGSRRGDDGGIKLRASLDPSDRPLALEAEGTLWAGEATPRFDGTVNVSRPAGLALSSGKALANVPWRASAKVRAGAASALLEQIEFLYGPEDQALKLGGSAELHFADTPRLDGVLSARQVDADRWLSPDGTRRPPAVLLRDLADTLAGVGAPLPLTLGIGLDNVVLGGGTLQAVRGDVRIDGDTWNLDNLEFRAPGLTQVRLSGALTATRGLAFTGPAVVESADPRALVAWLEGRTEATRTFGGVLNARGEVTVGGERIAVERLRAEFDRRTLEGRLAYAFAADNRPARLEATLKAAEFDLDAALAFAGNAFTGAAFERPGEIALALDFAKASYAGVEAKNANARLKFDAGGLQIERLAIADLGGATVSASGRIDTSAAVPRGSLALTLEAPRLDGAAKLAGRFAPQAAEAVAGLAGRANAARLNARLDVGAAAAGSAAGTVAKLSLQGALGSVRIDVSAEASGDAQAPRAAALRLDGRLDGDDGAALARLIGLDRYVALDKRAARVVLGIDGRADGDLKLALKFSGAGLDAAADGTLALSPLKGTLDVGLNAADARLLRPDNGFAVPFDVKTRVLIEGETVTFADLKGGIAGAAVSGRLVAALTKPLRIDGRLDADRIDVGALVGLGLGLPAPPSRRPAGFSPEPFAATPLAGLVGKLDFAAGRAALTSDFVAAPLRGTLVADTDGVHVEQLEGTLAAGRFSAQGVLRRGVGGIAVEGQVSLIDAELAQLTPKSIAPPPSGRVTLQARAEGSGRSPAALVGALRGGGTVTRENLQATGLDPAAIAAAIRAAEQGVPIDAVRMGDIVRVALDRGRLAVPWIGGGFAINDGRASFTNLAAPARDADVAASGSLDLVSESFDLNVALIGAPRADTVEGERPRVQVAFKGGAEPPRRNVEVGALVSWLTLRSVENEAKRLDAAEREARRLQAIAREAKRREDLEAARRAQERAAEKPAENDSGAVGSAPSRPESRGAIDRAPSLPPPIDIRPVPTDQRIRRVAPAGAADIPAASPR